MHVIRHRPQSSGEFCVVNGPVSHTVRKTAFKPAGIQAEVLDAERGRRFRQFCQHALIHVIMKHEPGTEGDRWVNRMAVQQALVVLAQDAAQEVHAGVVFALIWHEERRRHANRFPGRQPEMHGLHTGREGYLPRLFAVCCMRLPLTRPAQRQGHAPAPIDFFKTEERQVAVARTTAAHRQVLFAKRCTGKRESGIGIFQVAGRTAHD